MTADIAQLCDLIAQPSEPLALRLSSNLMVGAARVYKVKQEIFLSDVTACFNTLRKVTQELRSLAASDEQLQMAQPSVRPSAVTLTTDPHAAFGMDFDNMVADWNDYLNIGGNRNADNGDSDDDFDPKAKKQKQKNKQKPLPNVENTRADAHTLTEHHDFLLTSSFDTSFSGGRWDQSSSQLDGGLNLSFDENIFGAFDGLDLGDGIAEELARELGDGWGAVAEKDVNAMPIDLPDDIGMNDDGAAAFGLDDLGHPPFEEIQQMHPPVSPERMPQMSPDLHADDLHPSSRLGSPRTPPSALNRDYVVIQDPDQTDEHHMIDMEPATIMPKRAKRGRLLLDTRTELTDEELKTARMHYLEAQNNLRYEFYQKKYEKDHEKLLNDILWSVPGNLQAKPLIDFWVDHFRAHIEARSGPLVDDVSDAHPIKRRKIVDNDAVIQGETMHDLAVPDLDAGHEQDYDLHVGDMGGDVDAGMVFDADARDDIGLSLQHIRSSEEPGQARRVSRPPSLLGNDLGIDVGLQNSLGSQMSALFPWDNAGNSSSISGAGFGTGRRSSDKMSVDADGVRMRGRSLSRRESSVVPSQTGSLLMGVGASSAILAKGSQISGGEEDFMFDVPGDHSMAESSPSDVNLISLERNSYNFLEYARMQLISLSSGTPHLLFEDIVPKATSNVRVAAAALYHCLVLGTKDLIQVRQEEAYGPITLIIK